MMHHQDKKIPLGNWMIFFLLNTIQFYSILLIESHFKTHKGIQGHLKIGALAHGLRRLWVPRSFNLSSFEPPAVTILNIASHDNVTWSQWQNIIFLIVI